MRYLLLIRPSVVTWQAFGSATRIHITVTDTSGSEKVIAIATRGNQSWLLVTAQWKAVAEPRLAACVYCAQGLAWWHPSSARNRKEGDQGSAEPHLSGHQSYLKRPTFSLHPSTCSSNSHPNSHQLTNWWERKHVGCWFNGTEVHEKLPKIKLFDAQAKCNNTFSYLSLWKDFECMWFALIRFFYWIVLCVYCISNLTLLSCPCMTSVAVFSSRDLLATVWDFCPRTSF